MLELLKIIHLAALMAGAATGIGNGLLMSRIMASNGPPPDMVRGFMKTMGKSGLIAMVALWLSGIGMAFVAHDGLMLGSMFYLKVAGASLALICVVMNGRLAGAAEAAGVPPPLEKMKRLANLTWIGVITAVVFGVVRFS